ncbi:MAG: 30S ribosomal protein S4e [Nanoarchaeota archaeon]
MARMNHLSRLAAPSTWPIKRKGIKWVARLSPGTHDTASSMPLITWLKEYMSVIATTREAKAILNAGHVKVNDRVVKEVNFPIGLFDIITIESLGKFYRVLVDQNGKLRLAEITKSESKTLPLKITEKTMLKKGKVQLGFNNGWTIMGKDGFKVGDCIMYDVETKKIKSHFKPEHGVTVYVLSGEHANQTAKLDKVKFEGQLRKRKLVILSQKSGNFETSADKIFILGKGEPEISLK